MTHMRVFMIAFLALSLSGCQRHRIAEAKQQFTAAIAECKKGEELTRENAMERFDCISEAKRQFAFAVNAPDEWILEQEIANNRESAVQYSEGKISRQQYETAVQKNHAEAARADAEARAQPAPAPAPQPYVMPTSTITNTNCTGVGKHQLHIVWNQIERGPVSPCINQTSARKLNPSFHGRFSA